MGRPRAPRPYAPLRHFINDRLVAKLFVINIGYTLRMIELHVRAAPFILNAF